jgi:HK97 family phage major capsid protein
LSGCHDSTIETIMTLNELRTKRTDLLKKAQALVLKEKVTEAEIAEARNLIAASEVLYDQIESEENRGSENRGLYQQIPREQPGGGVTNSASQSPEVRAFSQYIRYGKRSDDLEFRDMTTGGTGGALIPQSFYPVLTEAKKAWGGIINELNVKPSDNGAPMKVALVNDVTNMLNIDSEPSQMSEVEASLSSVILACDSLKTDMIKVTVAELQDSYFDLDGFIRDLFGKRYYRGLTSLVTNGSWAGSPAVAQNIQSIITGATTGATSASATAIAWQDITNLYGSLDPAYVENAIFSMNSNTRAALLGVTDSLGRPLYIPAPTAQSFDTLMGRRVVLNQYLPDIAAGKVAIQFGDFKAGYLLREVKPGLAIVRLNERFMDTLEIGFLGYCRAAGLVTDAGTHPIVNLVQKSA